MANEVLDMDWAACEKHFRSVMGQYGSLAGRSGVNVMPALVITFQPLLKRFERGERSKRLYREMMAVE